MAMQAARFLGDPVLNACLAGAHRMLADEDNISVMRVQEALNTMGYAAGPLDGIFGLNTGAAVSAYKSDHGLQPTDPVVGPGTSAQLDADLFTDPAYLDPAFGEVASYVAAQVMDPFAGFEITHLLNTPLNSQRRDVGFFLLSALDSGLCRAIVTASRALSIPDPRVPAQTKSSLANLRGSGITVPFAEADGTQHVAIGFRDITLMGRRVITDVNGLTARVGVREVLCHEVTHLRNEGTTLGDTPDTDGTVFLDTGLAAQMSATGRATARVFLAFVHEMVASHVGWITVREDANDPFAARFLPPGALARAAFYYFAEIRDQLDFDWFHDNGYIEAFVNSGPAVCYQQVALWLRQCVNFTFTDDAEGQQISTQLFLDAADAADAEAANPGSLPPADGVTPGPSDFS